METNIEDIFKVTRGQVEHNENASSQRVIWLVIAQSFFFSAFAVLVTGNPSDPGMILLRSLMIILVPIAALLTVMLTYVDIIVGMIMVDRLRSSFDKKAEPGFYDKYPPVDGIPGLRWLLRVSPFFLPMLFIIVWIIIICNLP
jgi:hypothetical protein